jgi:hypothetical protein
MGREQSPSFDLSNHREIHRLSDRDDVVSKSILGEWVDELDQSIKPGKSPKDFECFVSRSGKAF